MTSKDENIRVWSIKFIIFHCHNTTQHNAKQKKKKYNTTQQKIQHNTTKNTTQHHKVILKLFLSSGELKVTENHLKEKTLSEILCCVVSPGKSPDDKT